MPAVEICILAGGLSTRMGRDKARLRLGGKTLLRRVHDVAELAHCPVRVIRRDLIARCGPLGGIYTALHTTRARSVLFLACDMPFVTVELIGKLLRGRPAKSGAVFTRDGASKNVGFPFILHRELLPKVERLLNEQTCSLQRLASRCRAKIMVVRSDGPLLFNVNTPDDWEKAQISAGKA